MRVTGLISRMNQSKRNRIRPRCRASCLVLIFVVLIVLCTYVVAVTLPFFRRDQTFGHLFIRDLFSGNDNALYSNLSNGFRNQVSMVCPDGRPSKCLNKLIPPDLGKPGYIDLVLGTMHTDQTYSVLYRLYWENISKPISLVLMFDRSEGREVVIGWRGFVFSEGNDEDYKLLQGWRRDNEMMETDAP